jgi:hypothetical protein
MAAQPAAAPPHAARAAGRPSRRGLAIAGLCGAFVLGTGLAGLLLDTTSSDLDVFFWPSAEIAAHGHPLLVYAVRSNPYPNANGPLALIPLTAVAALSNALGISASMPLRDGLAEAVFAVFSLLMAREALLAVESGRGRRAPRLATATLILALPPLWIATIDFGHLEAPLELWLLLLGIRLLSRGASLRAGICLGLAVLTRSLAVLLLIPLVLTLLAERRWRWAAVLLGAATLCAVAGIGPFLLADRGDVLYSLVTFRSAMPVAGGSLWFAFGDARWIGVVRSEDTWIFTALAAAICAVLIAARARQERGVAGAGPAAAGEGAFARRGLEAQRIFPLLAVSSLCTPMLAKTTWPYYLLDPCLFTAIWWLARPGPILNWRAIPCLAIALGGAALAGVEQHLPLPTLPGAITGVAASAGLAAVAAAIFADALRSGRRERQPPATASLHSLRC